MRGRIVGGAVVCISVGLAGCSHQAPVASKPALERISNVSTGQLTPVTPDVPQAAAPPSQTDGVPSASESLAQKLAAYSRDVEPQMRARADHRKQEAEMSALTRSTSQPSQVDWVGGSAFTLNTPPKVTEPTKTDTNAPASIVPPAAVVVVASVKSDDVPQIVPEGEDFDKATGPAPALPDTDTLMQQLAGKVHENPHDLSSQTDYQLIRMVRGDQVPDLKTLAGLTGEDRETVMALMDGLSNFRNNLRNDSNPMLGQKVRPLIEMADRLRSESDLDLPTASVCSSVAGFGRYEPMSTRFTCGRDHPVILYCEVANFASTVNDAKLYEVHLSNDATMYDATGMVVWQAPKSPEVVDKCRNRRHDFFLTLKTKLPPVLPIGRYVLKMSVTDQQSNRVAENNVTVEYVAGAQ